MSRKWEAALEVLPSDQYDKNFGSGYSASLGEMLSIMTGSQRKQYNKKTSLFSRIFKRK